MWGAIGGAASGALGATGAGIMGAAATEGAVNAGVYAGQTLQNGGDVTVGGVLTNFVVGAGFSVIGTVVSNKISGIISKNVSGNVDDVVKRVYDADIYDEFSRIADPKMRYEYLLEKSKTMDVSTEKNKVIFYAGRVKTANGTVSAREIAERYADQLYKEREMLNLHLKGLHVVNGWMI